MEIDYRGYRLQVRSSGHGWKVFIYETGADTHQAEVPTTADMFGVADVVAEAKKVVDELLAARR